MSVGIFRSRIFAAGRAFLRDGRGVSAVETAFAFPVILAAFFIIVEFANMALTIQVGESAVSSALLRFRDAGELGGVRRKRHSSGYCGVFIWLPQALECLPRNR